MQEEEKFTQGFTSQISAFSKCVVWSKAGIDYAGGQLSGP